MQKSDQRKQGSSVDICNNQLELIHILWLNPLLASTSLHPLTTPPRCKVQNEILLALRQAAVMCTPRLMASPKARLRALPSFRAPLGITASTARY
jgi:hypothetical protein